MAAPNIERGETDFETRRLIVGILRPNLQVNKASRWGSEAGARDASESLHHLIRIEFKPADHPGSDEILARWPRSLVEEVALFRALDRALLDALEEAEDAGLLAGGNRASADVPSIARHSQNAYRSGFFPIATALAKLWHRIAAQDAVRARTLALIWADSPFLLPRRLYLFAVEHSAFTVQEAAATVQKLDDRTFWISDARVEIMRLLVSRWATFEAVDQLAIEERILQGIPRVLYPDGAFEESEEWNSVRDSSIYRRLMRIQTTGGALADDSVRVLAEIASRHPQWRPGVGDRDDFHSWHETRQGPDGHPEFLAGITDDGLVREALRLQSERYFEEGDIWQVFCTSDPERALRGLKREADNGRWNPEAWRCLLWAAAEKDNADFQLALADMLLLMPEATLQELLPPATSWFQRRRGAVSEAERPGGSRFLPLWDALAELTYTPAGAEVADPEPGDDLSTEALNSPGGVLAWILLNALSVSQPTAESGLGPDLKLRFDWVAAASGRAGILGRVYLIQELAYLDFVDPVWTAENLLHRLSWDHGEALPLWRSYASHGNNGSARLFNALEPAMLKAFQRRQLSDIEFEGLMVKLLSVCIWHKRGDAVEYRLAPSDMKSALTVGPSSVRRSVAWNLWRQMGTSEGEPLDKATKWRELIGPLFRDIWPLDANLRDKDTSRNLALMLLECEQAFPEAVEGTLDFLIPYELYAIAHSLLLERGHEHLVRDHPVSFLRLANALIDPVAVPIPSDLAVFLQDCVAADPTVTNDPAYIRLYGFRRQKNA